MIPIRYNADFYKGQSAGSRRSAETVVPFLIELLKPTSVLDVGCGVGTWLSVFEEFGVSEVLGLDGDYVDRSQLQIDPSLFRSADLAVPFSLGRRFDLAISLEVAEHLPADVAPAFVEALTAHAPRVLFSAAIPFQGGTDHINEQWPPYWVDLFAQRDFVCVDVVRRRVWMDDDVDYWYAQNVLLFVHRDELEQSGLTERLASTPTFDGLPIVHPGLHLSRAAGPELGEMSLTGNLRAVGETFKTLLRLLADLPAAALRAARNRLTR